MYCTRLCLILQKIFHNKQSENFNQMYSKYLDSMFNNLLVLGRKGNQHNDRTPSSTTPPPPRPRLTPLQHRDGCRSPSQAGPGGGAAGGVRPPWGHRGVRLRAAQARSLQAQGRGFSKAWLSVLLLIKMTFLGPPTEIIYWAAQELKLALEPMEQAWNDK
jgi:hypothetical protein